MLFLEFWSTLSKKGKANFLGIVMALTFLLGLFVHNAKLRLDVIQEQRSLSRMAESVVKEGASPVAAELQKDLWGNEIVCVREDRKIHFVSKGPDGELDTEDDVVGEIYEFPKPKPRIIPKLKPKEKDDKKEEPSMLDRVKGWFR